MTTDVDPLAGSPRYVKVRQLGRGTFGMVNLYNDSSETGKQVAIKFLDRGPALPSKYVLLELLNHSVMYHPHVVRFQECFLTPRHLAIVLQYCGGGDMYTYVRNRRRLDEVQARWIFQQLIVAVDYLHKMGVACRDIKLENTLLVFKGDPEKPLVKMTDLGYSKSEAFQSKCRTRVGTFAYMAPEVVDVPPNGTYDGKSADMWSCGVMLYVMLAGCYPFERPEDGTLGEIAKQQVIKQRIMEGSYDPPRVSPEAADLLCRLLCVDVQRRATVAEVQAHSWYLEGLPHKALTMNDKLHSHPAPQDEAEIRRIVAAATGF